MASFYATEFSTLGLDNAAPGTGAVVRVPRHSSHPVMVAGGLNFPGGFAAGRNGALYVSNWSIAAGTQRRRPDRLGRSDHTELAPRLLGRSAHAARSGLGMPGRR